MYRSASRMESHGLPGMIHISASAYNRIVDKSAFAIRPRGTIEVKGKGAMTVRPSANPIRNPAMQSMCVCVKRTVALDTVHYLFTCARARWYMCTYKFLTYMVKWPMTR